MPAHKEGKKQRKWGRCKRSPAHQRYTAERRWLKHKERNVRHVARLVERHKE